ncbi:MAG: superoxide dismutase, Ni [Candidatus Marinimicrobia bacterium]|nr:superoxide dismutase, Ni [Candidatus Neomarinimicrobiota bacterium]
MKNNVQTLLLAVFVLMGSGMLTPQSLNAHCQVPCGIYDDHARLQSILEDAATVEKAALLINELAGKLDAQSQNQLVRWVNTKELHAERVIETISNYYLTQRVKPEQKDYTKRLEKHHAVILAAMRAKQNAAVSYGEDLTKSIQALSDYYPEHKH